MTMCAPSFHVVTCGKHQSMSYTSNELQTSNTISHTQQMHFKHQFIQSKSCSKCTSNIKYNQSLYTHQMYFKHQIQSKYVHTYWGRLQHCKHIYISYSLTVRQHACCKSLNAVKNRIYNYDKCDNWHLYASVKKEKNTYILTGLKSKCLNVKTGGKEK